MKWSRQEESIFEMKNILLAKPKIAHHPLLRLKLWQDKKKKKKTIISLQCSEEDLQTSQKC